MTLHVFGIRHHGPGSARTLRSALESLRPDIVLVEGPPDAAEMLPLITHAALRPPVALLIYPPDSPDLAVFYPFAVFSPEWQALRYALENGVPARFIDMPQAHRLATALETRSTAARAEEADREATSAEPQSAAAADEPEVAAPDDGNHEMLHHDPIGVLAEAAGYGDRELWWEHQIEQRQDATGLFDGIRAAMTALREKAPPPTGEEAQREAFMRTAIAPRRRTDSSASPSSAAPGMRRRCRNPTRSRATPSS